MAATGAGSVNAGIDAEHVGKMIKFVKETLAVSILIFLGISRQREVE